MFFLSESPNLGTVIVTDENDETASATPLAYLFTGSDADATDSFTFSLGTNSDSELFDEIVGKMQLIQS